MSLRTPGSTKSRLVVPSRVGSTRGGRTGSIPRVGLPSASQVDEVFYIGPLPIVSPLILLSSSVVMWTKTTFGSEFSLLNFLLFNSLSSISQTCLGGCSRGTNIPIPRSEGEGTEGTRFTVPVSCTTPLRLFTRRVTSSRLSYWLPGPSTHSPLFIPSHSRHFRCPPTTVSRASPSSEESPGTRRRLVHRPVGTSVLSSTVPQSPGVAPQSPLLLTPPGDRRVFCYPTVEIFLTVFLLGLKM